MKKTIPLLLLLLTLHSYAQTEADNWFFGTNAGLNFQPDGSVNPLFNGALNTTEGCSTISDTDGNLLFYTDGRNVWDRNHVLMPNGDYAGGTGLFGDPSSTQSGIIVPKKGDPDIYYIFTVDEPHHDNASVYPNQFDGTYTDVNGGTVPTADDGFNNGFNYSVVDLSVIGTNGSIGDVITRNIHLVTYDPVNFEDIKYKCSEKITAVKNSTTTGFWVITQFIDKFYAFEVDENGVNETPVISEVAPIVSTSGYRRNAIGYLKASPNGNMLALGHMQRGNEAGGTDTNGAVYLYDFNDATGVVSNALMVSQNSMPYGIEFSQQGKKLYVSYENSGNVTGLVQYDLLSNNIPGSGIQIATTTQSGALQLGPNGKIYRAHGGVAALDVINEPEEDGALCNYENEGQQLGGNFSSLGLPPFITSLFSADIRASNSCLGDITEFELNIEGEFESVSWDFGDGSPATNTLNPTHTYATSGNFTVVVTIVREEETRQVDTDIVISEVPVANEPDNLTECDTDNNGNEIFNLNANNNAILNGQSPATFEIFYFASQEDADDNNQPLNAGTYTNTANPQTIYARIQNSDNNDCYDTASFIINVSNSPVLTNEPFEICDDAEDGNDANGQAVFNLDLVSAALVQDATGFTTAYYASQEDAAAENNPLPQLFYNTAPNEQIIFAKVVNNTFTDCFVIVPVTLIVNPLPPVITDALLVQCDIGLSPDGLTEFNLTQAELQFTAGSPDLAVTYYPTEDDAENNTNEITDAYTNSTDPETVAVRVTNTVTGCYRVLPLRLQASMNILDGITLETCDDDGNEDGLHLFDLTEVGIEVGTNSVAYYANLTDALMEQSPINTDYTTTVPNQQSAYARIENNNECVALQEIILIVRPLPDIETEAEAIVCLNTNDYIMLDAGVTGSTAGLSYTWSTGAETLTIMINEVGTYTVTVQNIYGCEKVRTITVSPSDVAIINDIEVNDLRDNNTVTVYASPTGNVATGYLYSLDNPQGPWQESNLFENVEAGVHTVYVYDTNGCGIVSQEVAVLSIPKFFTPNGDGVNETWRITGINSSTYNNTGIYVYDRYGKLLSSVSPQGIGWDGNLNGYRLPSTDYWYVIEMEDGRIVKGHFSLIR